MIDEIKPEDELPEISGKLRISTVGMDPGNKEPRLRVSENLLRSPMDLLQMRMHKTEDGGIYYIYTIPEIADFSLKHIDYGDETLLQVDIIEIVEAYRMKGLATKLYKYVLDNLPTGYSGIISGTITSSNIKKIYENLKKEYLVEEFSGYGYIVRNKI